MKKIFLITCLFLASCESFFEEEQKATIRSNSASERINSTAKNSEGVFREVDEQSKK